MNTIKTFTVLLCLVGMGDAAHAQSFWQERDRAVSFKIEAAKPSFGNDSWAGHLNGMRLQAGTRLPVSSRTMLAIDFPLASSSQPVGFMQSYTTWQKGCPYVGFEFASVKRPQLTFELGLRVPLGNGSASVIGNSAEPERMGAFTGWSSHVWTFSTALNYDYRSTSNFLASGRIGLSLMIPSNMRLNIWGSIWPRAALQYGYRMGVFTDKLTVQAGLSGYTLIADEYYDSPSRLNNFVRMSAALSLGRATPEMFVSKPLGKSGDLFGWNVDHTFGLSLTIR